MTIRRNDVPLESDASGRNRGCPAGIGEDRVNITRITRRRQLHGDAAADE
jgi:hypothetical protein